MGKHIALLSGGLDSTVNLAVAAKSGAVRLALTCDYGQRAVVREIESASALCRHYGVAHQTIDIRWLGELSANPLTRRHSHLPDPTETDEKSADALVWLPNRNGVMLNIAAAFAEAMGLDGVLVGFNAEEAKNFPDNSAEFLNAAERAFGYSTRNKVKVVCHTIDMRKPEILKLAMELDAPLELCWWCYDDGERMCGRCGSCRRFINAAEKSGCAGWLRKRGVPI